MNTKQINQILQHDGYTKALYIGCFPSDYVPQTRIAVPAAFVANTDDSHGRGKHWCAFFVDQNRQGLFFDSFGELPKVYSPTFDRFLKLNCTRWTRNPFALQHPLSAACGYYACYAILMSARGLSLEDLLEPFCPNDKGHNDEIVHNSICSMFNIHIPMYDDDFLFDQIARTFVEIHRKTAE